MNQSVVRDLTTGCKTTATCMMYGHDIQSTGQTRGLYFEENGLYARRYWFTGELKFCNRQKCNWQRYTGDKICWKVERKDKQGEWHDQSEQYLGTAVHDGSVGQGNSGAGQPAVGDQGAV